MIRLLAGEIGATTTVLSLHQGEDGQELVLGAEQSFENANYGSLVAVVADFLHGERVDAAAFAVPGPVLHGAAEAPDLAWPVFESELRPLLGTHLCTLRNDVQAMALAVREVPEERCRWLQRVSAEPGEPVALVRVGTSYGRALLLPPDQAFASQAGFTRFGPRNVIERRLLDYLAERHEQVVLNHVLSKSGLGQLYDFLVHEALASASAQAELQRAADREGEIGRLGCRDLDQGCAAAVAFFADLLGAALGNAALELLPRGGLYVTGELVQALRGPFEEGALLESFLDNEAAGSLLRHVPLALVDEPGLARTGALKAAVALLAR